MTYSSKEAESADKPNTDVVTGDKPKFSSARSNQEKFTTPNVRAIPLRECHEPGMKYMSVVRETGEQVILGPNTKNTGTVKDALNAYKQRPYVAGGEPISKPKR